MGKVEDLAKLEREVKDTEIRIRTVQANVSGISRDIQALSTLETDLVTNLTYLKKHQIVVAAHEFKKVRDELAKTRTRITMMVNNRADLNKAVLDTQVYLTSLKRELEKKQNAINNNVIQVDFGGKNG